MTHYNADGGEADLCLNGTRCAARLAFHLGWAREEVLIKTGAGPIEARDLGADRIALTLAGPSGPSDPIRVAIDGTTVLGWHLDTGVPHFVIEQSGPLSDAPVESLGRQLRAHDYFQPAGTNVDFVRYVSPEFFEVRTFERGVEGETLACGTGVLAAAIVGFGSGRSKLPVRARTSGGFDFEVTRDSSPTSAASEKTDSWRLSGDARLVAEGTLQPGALEVPSRASWTR